MAVRLHPAILGLLIYLSLFILPGLLSGGMPDSYRLDIAIMLRQMALYTLPALLLSIYLVERNKRGSLKILLRPERLDALYVPLLLFGLGLCALVYRLVSNSMGQEALQVSVNSSMLTWLMLMVFTVASVFLEELFFRIWLRTRFEEAGLTPTLSAVLSSVLFAFAHYQQGIPGMLQALLAGLLLSWIVCKTGRLVAPLLSHVLFNAAVWLFTLS